LVRRVAALYRWQRLAQPVLLGGGPDLSAHRQHKRYLETTVAYDQDLLRQLHAESERQRVVRAQLTQKQDEFGTQKKMLAAARVAVGQEADKKKLLLAGLRQEKVTRLRALQQMEAAAARLQRMIDDVARRAQRRPRDSTPEAGAPMAPAPLPGRGTLDWPVRGTVSAPFGRFKHPEFGAEIVRKGIEISAAPGEQIRAVEAGRIAYADRFSGFGNLVIVDHGQRFFTIYGQLAAIVRKRGETLKKGDVLGQVGQGQIYFEMRRDGQSVDPLPWFTK
jgi:septal ring factor EnvC (AmiA/AmiB activator)